MKQFAVIGLGNFGTYLAERLYQKGHEVMAIDKRPSLVQEVKDRVSQAVVADGTDRKAMQALGLSQVDVAVVCIGSNLSDSILTTLNLKDIGVNRVLAKAISEDHGRILDKIGASEIFFPEKDRAVYLAEHLHNPNMVQYIPFMEGYSIIELAPMKAFVGKTLRELDLINRYGVQIIGVKEGASEQVTMVPTAEFTIHEEDTFIVLGPNTALDRLREREP
jgi:trk system potassium uptake protein TrkA